MIVVSHFHTFPILSSSGFRHQSIESLASLRHDTIFKFGPQPSSGSRWMRRSHPYDSSPEPEWTESADGSCKTLGALLGSQTQTESWKYRQTWSHKVAVLFVSTGCITYHLPYLYLPSNRNTTKAAEDSDCFNAKPLRACFSALSWNHFHRKRRFQKKLTALPPLHADPRKCGTLPANTWVKLIWNIQRGKWR